MSSLATNLSPENQKWVDLAEELSREKFAARAQAIDEEARFPTENYKDLADSGLLALSVPKEYGGIGADSLTYVSVLSKISKGCASTGLTFNMHSAIVDFLVQIASKEQMDRYFRAVTEDAAIFSSITSEPGSSFRDKLAVRTSIRKDGDGYRLNGKKHFCSLSTGATHYFTWSLLDGSKDITNGLLNVMIPADRPGIEIIDDWDTIGMRGTVSNSMDFKDVEVRPDEVIGAPGSILGKDMSIWSLGYTAVYIGIAEAAYEFCIDYAKTTKFRGMENTLAHSDRIQRQIGEMAMLIENARRAAEKNRNAPRKFEQNGIDLHPQSGEIPGDRGGERAGRNGIAPLRRKGPSPLLPDRAAPARRDGRPRHAPRQRPVPRNRGENRARPRCQDTGV